MGGSRRGAPPTHLSTSEEPAASRQLLRAQDPTACTRGQLSPGSRGRERARPFLPREGSSAFCDLAKALRELHPVRGSHPVLLPPLHPHPQIRRLASWLEALLADFTGGSLLFLILSHYLLPRGPELTEHRMQVLEMLAVPVIIIAT